MNLKKSIFSSKKVPLTNLDMKILKYIIELSYNQKSLAKITKSHISGVSKSLNRLIKYGFIYCIPSPIKIFQIIPERKEEVKKLIRGYDFGKNSPLIVDAHSFIFECKIKEFSKKFEKKLKKDKRWVEFNPNNWCGYKQAYLDGSAIFHKTEKKALIRFYFRTFAKSPKIAEMINISKFLHKKNQLENKYPGLKIGEGDIIAKCPYQHVALLGDPLSREAIKLGIKHKNIEDSHKIGGEWEEKSIDSVEKIDKLIKIREKELEDI